MRIFLHLPVLVLFLFTYLESGAQLTQVGQSVPSNFKKDFNSKLSQNNKAKACGVDTLYYGRYNSTSTNYINIVPTGTFPVTGAGVFYKTDGPVTLHGFNFYAYALTTNTPITCNVYYTAPGSNVPAGLPLLSESFALPTGLPFGLLGNLRKVTFQSPIQLTSDFVVTIETTNSTTMVVACNDWVDKDGLGKGFSSIKTTTGWSNNINVGGVPFDADFFIEPAIEYTMTPSFVPGENSCIGNGFPYEFINTTSFATNPQFSPEAIEDSLDDNFIWDYGDGSATDTTLNGEHTYASVLSYNVQLIVDFNTWSGNCTDDTFLVVNKSNLAADFTATTEGLLVRFKDKSTDATEWSWIFGDGSPGSVVPNPNHLYTNYGQYQVKLTVRNEGCVASTSFMVKLVPVGIDEQKNELNVSLLPNPASEFVQLKVDGLLDEESKWTLFNMHGKIISTGPLYQDQKIDLSGVYNGIYFLSISNQDQIQTKRLVIK